MPNFAHEELQIDPRDPKLVTYLADRKRFIASVSDLRAEEILPSGYTGARYPRIRMWSEKLQTPIPYKYKETVHVDGDVIVDVYEPSFPSVKTDTERKAAELSTGTQLRILHD